MSFTPQQSVTKSVSTLQLADRSSVASVSWQGDVYLFYVKNGSNTIYYTGTRDGVKWWGENNISPTRIGVAVNTSPSGTVFKDRICLFFNGFGNDGTFCAVLTTKGWEPRYSVAESMGRSMTFLPSTSPSAAVYRDQLFLFWVDSSSKNITYTSTSDEKTWSEPKTVPGAVIADGTSPYVIAFNGILYLFWNRNDSKAGSWYSTYSANGWTDPIFLWLKTKGGVRANTSPNALVLAESFLLRMFWVGSGGDGLWYTDHNPQDGTWTVQSSMRQQIGEQGLRNDTSASAAMLVDTPFVFWAGNSGDLWCSSGMTYAMDTLDWTNPVQWIRDKKSFSITSSNEDLKAFLKNKYGKRVSISPPHRPDDVSNSINKMFDGYSNKSEQVGTQVCILSALMTNAIVLEYYIQIEVENAQIASFIYAKTL